MKLYKNFDTQMKKLLSVAALAGAVLLCSCGGNKTLKMGSLSKFDSLSYALGANIGYGMQYEMSDIPFNFEEVNKGIKEGALDKSKQKHEDAIDILRDYFMNKRGARAFAIQQKKAMQAAVAADSTGMLKDTLPAAEPMFLTPASATRCRTLSVTTSVTISSRATSPYRSYGSPRRWPTCATVSPRWTR